MNWMNWMERIMERNGKKNKRNEWIGLIMD